MTRTAIGEAIYRLSGEGANSTDNPYHGTIDLILQDVTEIVEQEFYVAWALNSITLPKVTKLGYGAFYGCWNLKAITFGSVVTEGIENGSVVFYAVENCDLVLNGEQANADTEYQPNGNTWWNTEWKSITLK